MPPNRCFGAIEKIEILAELGVDATVIYPTDRRFLEIEARSFFEQVVRRQLDAKAMVEGPNFFFGHNRSGNVESLRQFCAESNMPFEVAEPVEVAGQIVSSSRIRSLVLEGEMAGVATMLGRPYRIRGIVVPRRRTRKQTGLPNSQRRSD